MIGSSWSPDSGCTGSLPCPEKFLLDSNNGCWRASVGQCFVPDSDKSSPSLETRSISCQRFVPPNCQDNVRQLKGTDGTGGVPPHFPFTPKIPINHPADFPRDIIIQFRRAESARREQPCGEGGSGNQPSRLLLQEFCSTTESFASF